MRVLGWFVLIAMVGCGGESQPTAPQPAEREAPAPVRDRPSEVEMVASMEAHYSVVILAHDALLQGDLESFRSQLAKVSDQELPDRSPQAWQPLHERLKLAAGKGATAGDLDAAAETLGQVVLACGSCHAALARGPIYPAPAPDDGASDIETAMLDHQWATERMWEGVTGPWDNAWQRGADSLATIEIFGDAALEKYLSDDLRRREQELREIGEQARGTTALEERAALYGRLLSTCGACHQAIGVTFEAAE